MIDYKKKRKRNIENRNNYNSAGMSLLSVLGVIFIVLRLCNVITWNWWLVCLPFIIEGGLILVTIIVTFIICLLER